MRSARTRVSKSSCAIFDFLISFPAVRLYSLLDHSKAGWAVAGNLGVLYTPGNLAAVEKPGPLARFKNYIAGQALHLCLGCSRRQEQM